MAAEGLADGIAGFDALDDLTQGVASAGLIFAW